MPSEVIQYGGPLGFSVPAEINIVCDAFEGTLATLVKCVANQKIQLTDVPLAPICQAYIGYLEDSRCNDFDSAANALIALAYLIERKAYRLLPIEPSEEDEVPMPDAEALGILDFEGALEVLELSAEEREHVFFRTSGWSGSYEIPMDLGAITVADLSRALERLLNKAEEKVEVFSRPRRSLADQMQFVLRCLSEEPQPLDEVVEGSFTRTDAVWWFLALLELIRTAQVGVDFGEAGVLLFWRLKRE